MAVRTPGRLAGDTKTRILNTAEDLFIECGYEAMSLRHITSRAEVNLAAVNYHFGSKEALIHAMLARRLDPLNDERLTLLERFEERQGANLTCEHVLGAMFVPALRLSQEDTGSRALLRLLARAYTDPSSFIRDFLNLHYAPVAGRFFDAFQRTLPHLSREELGWRLHFAIGALSSVLAGRDTGALIAECSQGKSMNDLQLVARLASLIVAALKAPPPDAAQMASFAAVLDEASERTARHETGGIGGNSTATATTAATQDPAHPATPLVLPAHGEPVAPPAGSGVVPAPRPAA
jgi:AcrR family transcriptional regulator